MSSVRNSCLAALPLATLLCSLGLRPAFIRHWRRQGSGPSTIVPVIGSSPSIQTTEKGSLSGSFSVVGLVGLEPMTSTMSTMILLNNNMLFNISFSIVMTTISCYNHTIKKWGLRFPPCTMLDRRQWLTRPDDMLRHNRNYTGKRRENLSVLIR